MNPTLTGRNLAAVTLMSERSPYADGHARTSSIDADRPSSFYAFGPPSNERHDALSSNDAHSISGSSRFSTLYRAIAGIGVTHSPTSPHAFDRDQQSSPNRYVPEVVRRQQSRRRNGSAGLATQPISQPRNFQHVLDNPVNPFAGGMGTRAAGGAMYHEADPFADPGSRVRIQRRPIHAQDISAPVLRESSTGF